MSSDPNMVPFLISGPLAQHVLSPYTPSSDPTSSQLTSLLREAGGSTLIVQTMWGAWGNVSHDGTGWEWGLQD